MARKIIVQERIGEPSDFNFRAVFWADVPTARQSYYADANKTSTVKDVSAGELASLRSGSILETSLIFAYVSGTSNAVIKADLIVKFNAYQAQVTSRNPWQFFGTSWDGTSWTNGGAV